MSSIFFDAFEDTNSVLFYDVDAVSSDDADADEYTNEIPGDSDAYQSGPENIDSFNLIASLPGSSEGNKLPLEDKNQQDNKDILAEKSKQNLENRKVTPRKEKRGVLPAPRPDISKLMAICAIVYSIEFATY